MSDLGYELHEWRISLEQAEIADWDGSDSELHDFPLAQWLCGLVADGVTVKEDTEILSAIIVLLDEEGIGEASPDFFKAVLSSSKGKTVSSFTELAHEHAEENYHPGEPGDPREEFESFVNEDDYDIWYRENAVLANEVSAESPAGGTLYWFDKSGWVQ